MDADLQHPPEKLPELIVPLERGESDFVLGLAMSRAGAFRNRGDLCYVPTRIATLLARPFAGAVR